MECKFHKALQTAKLLFLVLSLTLIPFLSSSLRPSYLYFLLNILIIVLGYESGILHMLVEPDKEKRKPVITMAPVAHPADAWSSSNSGKLHARETSQGRLMMSEAERIATVAAVQKATVLNTAAANDVRKAPASGRPSLFFIDSCDVEESAYVESTEGVEEEDEDVFVGAAGEISGQELFARAESFISNFYKQLKIQREDSWKKIHGLYHRPF